MFLICIKNTSSLGGNNFNIFFKGTLFMNNTMDHLVPIFRDVFDDDELTLTAKTTADDIDGWDSLAHIRLVIAIEKSLKLSFSAAEISEAQNVGEFVDLILSKQVNE